VEEEGEAEEEVEVADATRNRKRITAASTETAPGRRCLRARSRLVSLSLLREREKK